MHVMIVVALSFSLGRSRCANEEKVLKFMAHHRTIASTSCCLMILDLKDNGLYVVVHLRLELDNKAMNKIGNNAIMNAILK
jgi:hypothetical protein